MEVLAESTTVGEPVLAPCAPPAVVVCGGKVSPSCSDQDSVVESVVSADRSTDLLQSSCSLGSGGSVLSDPRVSIAQLYENAAHYRQLAERLPNKQLPLFGGYLQLAKEQLEKAKLLKSEEDQRLCASVGDVLDLHGFDVTRSIRILEMTIRRIRGKCGFRRLTISQSNNLGSATWRSSPARGTGTRRAERLSRWASCSGCSRNGLASRRRSGTRAPSRWISRLTRANSNAFMKNKFLR